MRVVPSNENTLIGNVLIAPLIFCTHACTAATRCALMALTVWPAALAPTPNASITASL